MMRRQHCLISSFILRTSAHTGCSYLCTVATTHHNHVFMNTIAFVSTISPIDMQPHSRLRAQKTLWSALTGPAREFVTT